MTAQIVDFLKECPTITQLSLVSLHPSAYIPLLECLFCEVQVTSVAKALINGPHADRDGSMDLHFGFSTDAVGIPLESVAQPSDSPKLPQHVILPHLHTIAITPMNDDNIADICKLITTRQEAGRAISCLKASSYDRVSLDRFQWLREHVTLDNL
jgi:hypothetical protein